MKECNLAPFGWWCSRGPRHGGPCAARPCWWNLRARLWMWRHGIVAAIALAVLMPATVHAEVDAVQATFLAPSDVGSFPITTAITRVDVGPNGVALTFDKADGPARWPNTCGAPLVDPGDDCKETRPDGTVLDMGALQYSFGLALKVGDQWFASAPIEIWHGRQDGSGPIQEQSTPCPSGSGHIHCNIFYDASRWGPLASVHPQPGDTIGVFVVAGDARSNFFLVRERSNIVAFPLPPAGTTASFTFTPGAPPADPPPVVTPPIVVPPAAADLSDVLRRLDALERSIAGLNDQVDQGVRKDLAQDNRIDVLEHKTIVTTCKASVFGVPIHCSLQ